MSIARRADKKVDELEAEIENMMKSDTSNQPSPDDEDRVEEPLEPKKEVVSSEEETFKQRYGNLRRHSQKREAEFQRRIEELEEKLRDSSNSIPANKERIEEWAKTNPQAAAIIRAIAEEQAGKRSNDLRAKMNEIEEMNVKNTQALTEAKVRKAHPDFDEIVADNAFHDWAETQPTIIQNLIYDNNSAKDVIWAINLYKTEKGIETPEKSAARDVPTKGKTSPPKDKSRGRFTESKVAKMSAEDFEKNYEQISQDMRSPEFYDITGGAR